MLSILGAILLMNLCAFVAFGFDKAQARNQRWRISEASLLTMAVAGGWIGAKVGQYFFRHKTYKLSFKSKLNAIPYLYALVCISWTIASLMRWI